MAKFILGGIFLLIFFYIVGLFPPLAVTITALGITFLFLIFGEK